jgi:molybdopterin synthase catalytic subunit
MNLSKMGMNVKKNISGALNTLLGIVTNSTNGRSKLQKEIKPAENVHSERELTRIVLEAEVKKDQATMIIHNAQNC